MEGDAFDRARRSRKMTRIRLGGRMVERTFHRPRTLGRRHAAVVGAIHLAIVFVGAPATIAQQKVAPTVAAPQEASPKAPTPTPSDQLKSAYRLVEVKANTKKNLRRAITLYTENLDKDGVSKPEKVKGLVDLSRAYLRLGDLMAKDSARIALYEKGRAAAQRATKLSPKHADAIFWDAANMALVGQTRGITNSLFMLGDLKTALNRVLKLDPSHNYARETLGRIHHAVPGMLGGSDAKAEKLFRECLRRDPNFTPCMVTLARFHIDNGDEDKARPLLKAVINAKKSSVPNDYRKFNLPDAKADLKRLR